MKKVENFFAASGLLLRKCYTALDGDAYFRQAYMENGCVSWPGNLDIDPDWLYEDSVAVTARE